MLVRAILIKRTLCQTELARTLPRPSERQVPAPKHDLHHRVKRLSHFLDNDLVDPLVVQVAILPYRLARLGAPGRSACASTGPTSTARPSGSRSSRSASPAGAASLPLLQVAYDRDDLPAGRSQNRIEEEALAAVLAALPPGCREVALAWPRGRPGLARQGFFQWAPARNVDFVVRIDKGTCVTDAVDRRTRLGTGGTQRGERRWLGRVRYALYHGRPTDIWLNVGISWQAGPPGACRRPPANPKEPWYLATTLPTIHPAVAWYRQRFWIEE